ncbi:PIN domain-containing protein [Thermococcus peptonophilus]|uniref:PIN domain-containing protein n=1 Tax=Thermococcus peptonophilus TaxID=53952 RepID=UPI001E45AD2F|nr:PIN domain-containing protein [Thermococcus peptonophilus]
MLPTDEEALLQAYNFMRKYNILPNDAIILAACKVNNIERLATLDEDLIKEAKKEELELL